MFENEGDDKWNEEKRKNWQSVRKSQMWFVYVPFGAAATAGSECMPGSAMYFMSTGISLEKGKKQKSHNVKVNESKMWRNHSILYHSQMRMLLSSDVLMNRRLSSINVMVFTAPRCRSYSWTISPDRVSHWEQKQDQIHPMRSQNWNGIRINSKKKPYAKNLFILHSTDKQVLLLLVRVEFDTMRGLFRRRLIPPDTFTWNVRYAS